MNPIVKELILYKLEEVGVFLVAFILLTLLLEIPVALIVSVVSSYLVMNSIKLYKDIKSRIIE